MWPAPASSSPSFLYTLILIGQAIFVFGSEWIEYPASGIATMTHYTLPLDFIASCGCAPASTHYPTAALNQMAYGSSAAFGPGCGRCFNLTLLNTFLSEPPFFPNVTKSVVVKVTDLCPLGGQWCSATPEKANSAGSLLNFDLNWPSTSIPDDFFPSDPSLYGYTDFGVWNISYQSVACQNDWAGSSNSSAFGAVSNLGTSVCCPTDPFVNTNTTCPSYSDLNGLPPEAVPAAGNASPPSSAIFMYAFVALTVLCNIAIFSDLLLLL